MSRMTFSNLTAETQSQQLNFSYVPRPGLLKITLVNLVFNILTFSVYRFWGKTNVRRHIWSCIHINGEPLEYTGTGKELFKGFLFVFGLVILPFILVTAGLRAALGEGHPAVAALNALFFLFVYIMFGFAVYKARRYQLTRTLWRGIRGNLAGSAMTYSLTYFGSMLARGASLGWATPVMNTVMHEQITNDMRFGDAAFKFKGRAGPLYPTYTLCWFMSLTLIAAGAVLIGVAVAWLHSAYPDLGAKSVSGEAGLAIIGLVALFICYMVLWPALWSIYVARQMRVFADYTRFDGAQFRLGASAGSIILLTLGNFLLLVFTLGFAWPFIQQRTFRYVFDRLGLEGTVDVNRIAQSSLAIPKRGEGLADAFDVSAW
jgi:uncharacterized membrane protein YjgN (DUF898 family)